MFDLTRQQLESYLDWAEKNGTYAGIAYDTRRCPLAEAYRHHHNFEEVEVGLTNASGFSWRERTELWHTRFIRLVDQNQGDDDDKDYPITVEQARKALNKAFNE